MHVFVQCSTEMFCSCLIVIKELLIVIVIVVLLPEASEATLSTLLAGLMLTVDLKRGDLKRADSVEPALEDDLALRAEREAG